MSNAKGETIALGVVGLGKAAHTIHLPAIAGSRDVRIAGIWDEDPAAIEEAIRRYPGIPAAGSFDELCADETIDGVIVATPPDSHHEIGLALIRAGRAVLIEKPLAPTFEACRDLVDAAAEANVPLAVGHSKRFHPTLRVVRQLIAEGQVGKPFFIGVHWATDVKLNPDAFIPFGYENYFWRWRDTSIGGGIGQDHIPHYLDLVRFWTGSEPQRILGHSMNVAQDFLGWEPSDSVWEDFSVTVVEMDNGCVLRLETGVVGRSISPLLGTGHGSGEWTEYAYILGTEGKLVVDLPPWESSETGRVALWRADAAATLNHGWTLIEQPEPIRTRGTPSGTAFDGYVAQAKAFQDWIAHPTTRPAELATGEDGAVSIAVVEAAYRSGSAGRWIEMKEVTGEVENIA